MRTFIVTLATGRFGDWVVVDAQDEEAAKRALTRTQRKKIGSITESIPTKQRRADAEAQGLPFPVPVKYNRRRRAAA